MKGNLIIENAHIVSPKGKHALKGVDMGNLHELYGATIVIENGWIRYVGNENTRLDFYKSEAFQHLDVKGKVVLPGFVDSHTHIIFGGFRPDEFEWRLKGKSYMSIMKRGGGIQSTVNSTRKISEEELFAKAKWFLNEMSKMGVTTVEAKSGYGLDLDNEKKMLEVISRLQEEENKKVDIIATFMGAHAIPIEFKGKTSEYIDYLIEMLPLFSDKAKFCDVFCEKNVFELENSHKLLTTARKYGYKLKLHADEIVGLGGAELSAAIRAVSADHLLHVSEEGIKRMSENNVVATLLPLTAFALREDYAPARKFIDSGCAVALATDLNPGSCLSGSIPLTIALACIYMKMSIEETITALTLNGAAALDMADEIGSIEEGKRGNLAILGMDNYNFLPYYVGMNCVQTTIFKGEIVNNRDDYFS